MPSTVPRAKQAILDLLKAIPDLNTVSITPSEPTEEEDLADEMIFFRDPVRRQPEWRVLGGAPLDETYTLTLVIRNRVVGDDEPAAEARCWELVGLVEQAVRVDTTLGGLLSAGGEHHALAFGEQEIKTVPLSDGWYGEAVIPLACHARI